MTTNRFDAIISVSVRDVYIVQKTVKYVNKNISPEKTYLITNKRLFHFFGKDFLSDNNVVLLDEEQLLPGMNINKVREMVDSHFIEKMRGGWYFQQFLKMAFALTDYAQDYYLIWDADTIPTSKINFFDNDGKMLIAYKDEYNEPYFTTMKRLLGFGKSFESSFIAEHMIIKTNYMRELISKIGAADVEGNCWWEKILNATPKEHKLSFSEFETYGTYLNNMYPYSFKYRQLHTFRTAGKIFGRSMKDFEIKEFDGVCDTISLESNHFPPFPRNLYQFFQMIYLRFFRP